MLIGGTPAEPPNTIAAAMTGDGANAQPSRSIRRRKQVITPRDISTARPRASLECRRRAHREGFLDGFIGTMKLTGIN